MDQDTAILVSDLRKEFVLPQHKHTSFKQVFVNLGKRNKKTKQRALSGVSFEVKKGDFFGVVGRNGSGKSTLLKILAGVYSPTVGSVSVNGSLTPFIELGVGFNPELSGRDNVFLNGALLGFNRKEMSVMYQDIVEFAELEKFMDQKLKNYSSGMQVRLAFSISIRAKSDILLLDEVLAVGDAAFQQKCYSHFEELKRQKKTVVFVSHDMNAVRRFCNKAIYIDGGKLTHSGVPSEIADVYVEDNMESSRQNEATQEGPELSKKHKLTVKLSAQTNDTVTLHFSYKSEEKDKMYIGISVIREGISIAEINTSSGKPLKRSGRATYSLDVSPLNAGVYSIGAGLFRSKNGELLSVTKNKAQFIVKGSDPIRGAALKLADTWKYE